MSARRNLVVVFSLHFLLHVYIAVRLMPDIGAGRPGLLVLTALLLLSTLLLAPVGLMSSSLRRRRWSEQLAWLGLLAMGLFSSFFVLTFLRDMLLLAAWLIGIGTGLGSAELALWSAIAVPLLALVVTLVGFVNARRVARVVKVDVPIAGLPEALHGYTIAQVSDIHVGPTIRRAYLEAIVKRVNALQADAIAVTGDLVDGSVQRLAAHTEPLRRLQAPDGAFFVTGNHEYYSGAEEWIAEVRRMGLTVLLNGHVLRRRGGATLMIAGVTDYSAHHFNPAHRSDPKAAIAGAPQEVAVKILLAHQPRSAPAALEAGFDLQLSGHTHGGQFFPWNLFVPLQQPYVAGLHRTGRLWVYTSRGTGYWGPPKRFGAPSEITLVRLVAA